jgi:hypothetical protein
MRLVVVLAVLFVSNVADAASTSVTRWGPWYGTYRGAGFQQECAPGFVVVGLHGRSGSLIDQLIIECAQVTTSGGLGESYWAGVSGGDGGGGFSLSCASGYAVETIYGRTGSRLDRIGIMCRSLNWWYSYVGPSTGGYGGGEFWDSAQPGEFVTGIMGRTDQNAGASGILSGVAVRYSVIRW